MLNSKKHVQPLLVKQDIVPKLALCETVGDLCAIGARTEPITGRPKITEGWLSCFEVCAFDPVPWDDPTKGIREMLLANLTFEEKLPKPGGRGYWYVKAHDQTKVGEKKVQWKINKAGKFNNEQELKEAMGDMDAGDAIFVHKANKSMTTMPLRPRKFLHWKTAQWKMANMVLTGGCGKGRGGGRGRASANGGTAASLETVETKASKLECLVAKDKQSVDIRLCKYVEQFCEGCGEHR